MIYRRKTYKVTPEQCEKMNGYFHEYLLPNQLKHGARLVGRWTNEARTEIVAIWEYESREEHEEIEARVQADEMHARAQARRQELGPLFEEAREDWLLSTGPFAQIN